VHALTRVHERRHAVLVWHVDLFFFFQKSYICFILCLSELKM
jgi:hypothetical protein